MRSAIKTTLTVLTCLVLAACTGGHLPTPAVIPSSTNTAMLTVTPTLTPTLTSTPSRTVTPTSTPHLPVFLGTPLPTSLAVNVQNNLDNIMELARWGRGTINGIAWSPDGKTIAAGSSTGLIFYDANNLTVINYIPTDAAVIDVAFTKDGKFLAGITQYNQVLLLNLSNYSLLNTLDNSCHSYFDGVSITISPDGNYLAASVRMCNGTPSVWVWRTSDWSLLHLFMAPDNEEIAAVAFSPKGDILAVGVFGWGPKLGTNEALLWNLDDYSLTKEIKFLDVTQDLTFNPDGTILASANSNGVELRNVSHGINITNLSAGYADHVLFSSDGKLITASADDGKVRIWKTQEGTLLYSLEGDKDWVRGIAFSPDGTTLASGSADGTIRIWRVSDGSLIKASEGQDRILGMAISPDGKKMITFEPCLAVRQWQIPDGVFSMIETDKIVGAIYKGKFSPYSYFMSPPDCVTPAVYVNGNGPIFSPDGTKLVLVTDSGSYVLSFPDNHPIYTIESCNPMAFSPDGQYIACGVGLIVNVIRASDGKTLGTHSQIQGGAQALTFSPDGKLLAVGMSSGIINLWNVSATNWTFIRSIDMSIHWQYFEMVDLAFSPNGRLLALDFLGGCKQDNIYCAGMRSWQVSDWEPSELLTLPYATFYNRTMSFSPDSSILAIGDEMGNINILSTVDWTNLDWTTLARIKGHTGEITGLVFDPSTGELISSSMDGTIRFWGIAPHY